MQLKRLYVSFPIMRTFQKYYGDVVSFDTTFNTNRFGLFCGLIIGMSSENKTVILAFSLIDRAQSEDYQWVFDNYLKCCDQKPICILTDGELAIISAVKKCFPETKHNLCLWHIQRNIKKNLGYLSKKNNPAFIKCYDQASKLMYSEEFEKDYFAICSENNLPQSAKEYLENIYRNKDKWAFEYTQKSFNAGILTISRNESIHSRLKHYLNFKSKTNLKRLLEIIILLTENSYEKIFPVEKIKNEKFQKIPIVNITTANISNYASNLMIEQFIQSFSYNLTDEENKYLVYRKENQKRKIKSVFIYRGNWKCDCYYFCSRELIC